MTLVLQNGNYLPDGLGGFQRAQGAKALLAEVLFRLSCRRGAFPLLPKLGSRLHSLVKEKPSAWEMMARQYCAEALEGLNLQVDKVSVTVQGDDCLRVAVHLRYHGDTVLAEVKI